MKRSIKSPFKELPEPIRPERLEELVEKLRKGDKSGNEEILLGHLRLIISLVGESPSHFDNLNDDLISEVILATIETINRAETKLYDNNITPYIVTNIRGTIKDYCQNQFLTKTRTYNRKRKNENQLFPLMETLKEEHINIGIQPIRLIEIVDLVNHCINLDDNLKRREYKKAIIQLRASSYNDTEIAGILDISIAYVSKIVREIEKQYNELD